MSTNNIIIYLHGFRSSPASYKAQVFAQRMSATNSENSYFCPQLPASPAKAIALVQAIMHPYSPDHITLVGSSLGGYYSNWLAEQSGCRAVLLNPMTRLLPDMAHFVGVTTSFHTNEHFEFKPEFVDELRAIAVTRITRPERYLLLAATGDELLDWHDMVEHYAGAQQIVIEGSNHGLSGFEPYLDDIFDFCRLPAGENA